MPVAFEWYTCPPSLFLEDQHELWRDESRSPFSYSQQNEAAQVKLVHLFLFGTVDSHMTGKYNLPPCSPSDYSHPNPSLVLLMLQRVCSFLSIKEYYMGSAKRRHTFWLWGIFLHATVYMAMCIPRVC